MQLEQRQQQEPKLLELERQQEQQLVLMLLALVLEQRLALEQEQPLLLSYRKQPGQQPTGKRSTEFFSWYSFKYVQDYCDE